MNNYILGVDIWEGQLEVDEKTLLDNGVEFAFIRLNDMQGGHHKDTGFDKQWMEAINFVRAPYVVYNPWVSGAANYNYFRSILPAGITALSLDVEVKYIGYSTASYAAEVENCIRLMRANGLKPIIYSGSWFMSYLSYWLQSIRPAFGS